jgi:hypothetical protein
MSNKRKILVGVIVVAVIGLAGLGLYLFWPSSYTITICKNHSNDALENCVENESIQIIRGTENLSETTNGDSSIKEKCAERGGRPVYDAVGGFVGVRFMGCSPE